MNGELDPDSRATVRRLFAEHVDAESTAKIEVLDMVILQGFSHRHAASVSGMSKGVVQRLVSSFIATYRIGKPEEQE